MTTYLEVRHAFDAAHRLPQMEGKCQSLHGHTWRLTVTLSGSVGPGGIVVDMGDVKRVVRGFVDAELDHGTLLGRDDKLVEPLRADGATKLFVFDGSTRRGEWPTVENVARCIGLELRDRLAALGPGIHLSAVRLAETDTNAVVWTP